MLAQRLPRFTPATRTDSAWIAADLQRIRARGYLVTADEVVPAPLGRRAGARCLRPGRGGTVRRRAHPCGCARRGHAPLVPLVLDAAAKLSHILGASGADTVVARPADPARKGSSSAAAGRDNATIAPALASPGPHSIFR